MLRGKRRWTARPRMSSCRHLLLGASAGQRQEHLVECRLAEREVADLDPGSVQLGECPGRVRSGIAVGRRDPGRKARRVALGLCEDPEGGAEYANRSGA